MFKRWMVAAIAASIAVSSFGVAMATSAGPQSAVAGEGELTARGEEVLRCDGGKHKEHKTRMSATPVEFNEADGTVTVASLTIVVPKGRDTLEVDFNAETRLRGSSDENHWLQLGFYLNGVLMQPNDPISPLALADDNRGWESNMASACERVPAGTYKVEVRAKAVDFNNSANLSAWLDDWVFEVDRFG